MCRVPLETIQTPNELTNESEETGGQQCANFSPFPPPFFLLIFYFISLIFQISAARTVHPTTTGRRFLEKGGGRGREGKAKDIHPMDQNPYSIQWSRYPYATHPVKIIENNKK